MEPDPVSSGELVWLTVPSRLPARKPPGWATNDPLEQEFLEDLARFRREDLDRTLRDDEPEDPSHAPASGGIIPSA